MGLNEAQKFMFPEMTKSKTLCPTVGFNKFMFHIFFQTLGLLIFACVHFLRQMMESLWFGTSLYVFGYVI